MDEAGYGLGLEQEVSSYLHGHLHVLSSSVRRQVEGNLCEALDGEDWREDGRDEEDGRDRALLVAMKDGRYYSSEGQSSVDVAFDYLFSPEMHHGYWYEGGFHGYWYEGGFHLFENAFIK